MAKAAARKPAPKAQSKPAPQAATSKAAQAAAHQGRPAPVEPERKTTAVPAVRQQAQPPADPALTANLPSFMRGDAGAGTDSIKMEDLETPRLKLMQGLSPELEEFDGLRPGFFFHPAAEWIFDEPFRAVPLFMDRRYILWNPRDNGGGILARADDGIHWSPGQGEFEVTLDKKDGGHKVMWRLAKTVQQSGLAKWGTMNPSDPNSPPAATLMFNYLLAFPDHPELMPAILTFQRSAIKSGRKFNTKIKTNRAPLYGTIWEFSSFKDTNSRGQEFHNINVRGAGLVEDEGLYNLYKGLHQQYSGTGLNIKDIEGLQDEASGDNMSDEGDGPRI